VLIGAWWGGLGVLPAVAVGGLHHVFDRFTWRVAGSVVCVVLVGVVIVAAGV